MRQVSRRLYAKGFTLLELLIVIAVIAFLVAAFFAAGTKMRERTRNTQSRKLVEMVHNALDSYKIDFRAFPPDSYNGYTSSEALVYFLTSTFRITPATGEVQSTLNGGPYAKFNETETRDLGSGHPAIIDAWGSPLTYKLEAYTEPDPWQTSKQVTSYRVRLYSLGPNKTDDNGTGDDVMVGKAP